MPQALGDSSDGVRTLPVNFEGDGASHRDYRDSVSMLSFTRWKQLQCVKPRAVKWLCTFFKINISTPTLRHKNWRHILKVQIIVPGVSVHEVFCRVLERSLCCHEFNVSELDWIEILARCVQLHEDRNRLELIEREGSWWDRHRP